VVVVYDPGEHRDVLGLDALLYNMMKKVCFLRCDWV
jgi:hypothetical protein